MCTSPFWTPLPATLFDKSDGTLSLSKSVRDPCCGFRCSWVYSILEEELQALAIQQMHVLSTCLLSDVKLLNLMFLK